MRDHANKSYLTERKPSWIEDYFIMACVVGIYFLIVVTLGD